MRVFLIFIILLFFANCGIERPTPVLLVPIANSYSDISQNFEFQNQIEADNNKDILRGFELYYKFYNSATDAAIDNNIQNYYSIITDQTLGFKRITKFEDNDRIDKPLIPISSERKELISKFTIDFMTTNNVTISINTMESIETKTLFRGVKDQDTNLYKSFENLLANDADLKSITDINNEIYISLYVMSYGIFELSREIYSEPVWLGNIQLAISN